jgi:inner membrane protein
MDNLTHTLIGALVGETTARSTAADANGLSADMRRTVLVGCAAVGSNLPDSDLLYSFFGAKVNYLLHHRGHTHTVIGALLLTALIYALVQWWLRRHGFTPSRVDRGWIAGVLLLTSQLHIGMDFMNNYGVHPFWPVDSRWWYGDSVFIIEPLLWAACAPLAILFRAQWARAGVMLLLTAGLGLVFLTGMVPTMVALLFAILVGAMLFIARVSPPPLALGIAVAFWLGVTGLFSTSAGIAADRIEQAATRDFPNSRLLDHVLSPMPANPLCWEAMLIQAEGDQLTLRRAMLALAPGLLPAERCGRRSLDLQTTAPLVAVRAPDRTSLEWHGEIQTPRSIIASLAAENCAAAAALRFMRAPYVVLVNGKRVLGDLRYDREPGLGFAEIQLDGAGCAPFVPSWTPPRADFLR